MFGHWIPIDWIWIGRKLGHLNESPVAEPTVRNTPKPGFGDECAVAEELEVPGLAADLE